MLELKNIKKSYKVGETTQQVLKGIDIKFGDNEFTAILGSSGSGKTTLLNIIGGLDKYDDGDLIIDGVSTKNYLDRDWDSYRNYKVGFIFQSYNLIMHQTVLSNVEIALTLSGVSKEERKQKAIDALKKVGLEDHIYKRPNQLSGGQMQRVAIARALVNDPTIILADEPTGALDSKTSIQIMDLLKEIAKDKLIIMVTHNPELAKEYSTRIIELKDGKVINDSKPCKEKEKEKKDEKVRPTSMSLLTSLSLSFNNLLTKKGRTFLTAVAGSIGIIGIALILSISNGVSNVVKDMEKNSLGEYPINIEKQSLDIGSLFSAAFSGSMDLSKCDDGKLCSSNDLVGENSLSSQINAKNNTREAKKYVDSNEVIKNNSALITYNYNLTLQVFTNDYQRVNPSNLTLQETASTVFTELTQNKDDLKKNYKVLAGKLPEAKDEIVLVVGKDRKVADSVLYSLGVKDKKQLAEDFEKSNKDSSYKVANTTYKYEDFLNKTFKVILNTDYYVNNNGAYVDYSNNVSYMKQKINSGTTIKIVGVVENEGTYTATIGYLHDLTTYVIGQINNTEIYKKQTSNRTVNVLTGEAFDGVMNTYENIETKLGLFDLEEPSTISIYPKNYDAKNKIVEEIDKHNDDLKKDGKENQTIKYTDVMKSLVGTTTNIVNMVSYVLIAFVAISLIVSSIMISIITYISVLERTKEIGILRAIGASKKDIIRVFRAETIIEGAIAGILGILVAFILSLIISAVVAALVKVQGVASLNIISSIILILLSIGLNVIAGTIPSKMAAKKDPVEALRTE